MSECASLPEGVWRLILVLVPLRPRLSVCALVSRTLCKAAVAATSHLCWISPPLAGKRQDSLCQWLSVNGHLLTSLRLEDLPELLSRLPCRNLCQLKLRHCRVQLGPSSLPWLSQPGVLQDCTALTQLVLHDCGLMPGSCNSLTALSAVPALQDLQLSCLRHEFHGVALERDRQQPFDLPSATLSCLQELTYVSVRIGGPCDPLVSIEHISCLKSLQQLDLYRTAGVTPSNTPGLEQLTALQEVWLKDMELDPAALQSCTGLRHLRLHTVIIVSNSDNPQSLLPWIGRQQQLRQLQFFHVECDWPTIPNAYTALSASSKLQRLDVRRCALPIACHAVFSPGQQQLPELRTLVFDVRLPQQSVDVLILCCPALKRLGVRLHSGVQLAGLAELTALRELGLADVDDSSCTSLSALSALSSLARVLIEGNRLEASTLQQLTALQRLTFLDLSSRDSTIVHDLRSLTLTDQGPVTQQPDVWSQLLGFCRDLQQQQVTALERRKNEKKKTRKKKKKTKKKKKKKQ